MNREKIFSLTISLCFHLFLFLLPTYRSIPKIQVANDFIIVDITKPVNSSYKKLTLRNNSKTINRAKDEKHLLSDDTNIEVKNNIEEVITEEISLRQESSEQNLVQRFVDNLKNDTYNKEENIIEKKTNSSNMLDGHKTFDSKATEDLIIGRDNAPKFLKKVLPIYPLLAKKLGIQGVVVLRLTIDEHGNLLETEVIESAGYGMTESAVEAVRKSTFSPAKINGKPILSKALLTIRFNLDSEKR
ncbi:MAG: energy transducer TonB [Proteobacteria bacterium]|nr:energy transducer TonB [Pseudomonadota bacterium]